MVKFSDVMKTFLMKLYILLIIFLIIFGFSSLHSSINNKPGLLEKPTFMSSGELAISSNSISSEHNLNPFMNNIIYRINNDKFINIVVDNIKSEVNKENGKFKDLSDEDKETLKNIENSAIKDKITIEIISNTTIFKISYKHEKATIAQAINNSVINCVYNILNSGDTDNVLGGAINYDGLVLEYSINKEADLPAVSNSSNMSTGNNFKNILKILLISFAVYIVVIAIYDFAMGYINSKQKVKTMVLADIVSEIEVPYFKNRKNVEEK